MDYITYISKQLGRPIITYQQFSHGRDYEVFIVDDILYRFPKQIKTQTRQKMYHEKKILDALSKHITACAIPQFSIVDETYMKGPAIKGNELDQHPAAYTDQVIETIVLFLQQLHRISPAVLDITPPDSKEPPSQGFKQFVKDFSDNISIKLQKHITDTQIQSIQDYIHQLFFTFQSPNMGITHTDIQSKNIIQNTDTGKIEGIIDFSNLRYGSIEGDFCHFYALSPQLCQQIITKYLGAFDQAFYDRVIFLAKRNVLFTIYNDETYQQKDKQEMIQQLTHMFG